MDCEKKCPPLCMKSARNWKKIRQKHWISQWVKSKTIYSPFYLLHIILWYDIDTNASGETGQTTTTSSSRANTRKLRKRAANEQQGDRTSSRKKQTLDILFSHNNLTNTFRIFPLRLARPSIAFEAKDNEVNDDLMTLRKQSMIGVSAVGMAFGGSATGLSISSSGIRSSTRRSNIFSNILLRIKHCHNIPAY